MEQANAGWIIYSMIRTDGLSITNEIHSNQSNEDDSDLQMLLSLTDLLATCAEGDNVYIESVCQTVFSLDELIK